MHFQNIIKLYRPKCRESSEADKSIKDSLIKIYQDSKTYIGF